jgi:pyrroline-5-carboxylate reductase
VNIAFLGGGNMASALIGGLIAKGLSAADIRVVEIDSQARARLKERYRVVLFERSEARAVAAADIVVLAVKPQQLREAAVQLGPMLGKQIVLSIAAGIRLSDLARWLGTGAYTLVRAMPNTPALIGEGIAGLYSFPPKATLPPAEVEAVERVMGAVGEFVWIDDEAQMDAVTALSGSGPAYVFWFIEQLAASGRALGLPEEVSRKLALRTVLGAAKLAAHSGETPTVLRERVTSKGGTTEAALRVFDEERLAERLRRALEAASRRGAELGEILGKD